MPVPQKDTQWQIRDVKEHLAQVDYPLAAFGDGLLEAILAEFRHAPRLMERFTPGLFQGDLLFFRATVRQEHHTPPPAPDAWQPHVQGRITVHDIACQHGQMMRPKALAQIGPILAASLDLAQSSLPPYAEEQNA